MEDTCWNSSPWLPLTPTVWVSLQDEAKEDFGQAIGWCVSLITDYRVRLGTRAAAPSLREKGDSSVGQSAASSHWLSGPAPTSVLCTEAVGGTGGGSWWKPKSWV